MATILVVDDYAVTQRMLTYQLYRQGHQVVTANNGYEALDSLNSVAVDLLIVDLAMPEMDGLTVLRQLRASTRFHSLPVIMLTASGKQQDRHQAQKAGVDAFLTKPTNPWQLVSVVDDLLVRAQPVAMAA
ncbi:MAG: response regulator [Caldilineaceae bacterium]|nr:response regulator [Caldilineaceae bacterium]HRJ42402.1 response regulator [Caldilineaceae bacterium]